MSTPSSDSFHVATPHTLDPADVLGQLNSTPDGLSAAEAARRLEAVGPNRLPQPPRDGAFKRFFKHFNDLLIYVLIGAGLITAFLGHWLDTAVIFGVVVINAVIGFIQEGKAEQALEGIRKMLSLHAHARRDGVWSEIDAEHLVPGDIVRLRSGDRVPADLRLIDTNNLRIEESALTGESVPASKSTDATGAEAGIGDRHGMAYSGCLVSAGRGVGVVIGTGSATELGRITQMIANVEKVATPLTRQMAAFGKILSIAILTLAVLMFAIGWWFHDYAVADLFLASIGFAVAAIPEGLPAVLTITLAIGVQQMARRNAITRRLDAVETLGAVTVICSDKTGTLTRNEMTARHVITRAASYQVTGSGYDPEGKLTRDQSDALLSHHPDLRALVETMAICNDSLIGLNTDGHWHVTGEPTEGALVTLGRKAAFDPAPHERIAAIPFESHNKFMATLNRVPDHPALRLHVKGAPDRLLARCARQLAADGRSTEILDHAFWEHALHDLSSLGLRVLAAASRDTDAAKTDLSLDDLDSDRDTGLVFLGLVGITDPPRPEAIKAIKICREAGIRVKMITGDHAGTATAIGREMGITDHDHAITGAELEAASDEQLRQVVRDHDIFARTSPEHKLRLVTALQANREVVAMTGDGVNDAPALKRADVGIAMGIKGTEATKEAAEIVLADDNFASIERAVEQGRVIYDNLRKAIAFILPTNGAQAFVVLGAVVFGWTLPLEPVQILWVNMVIAVTLAIALAFEPAEPGLMQRSPRSADAPMIDGHMLWRVGFVSVLIGGATIAVFLHELSVGTPVAVARTLAVNTLVCAQVFYLFNSRYLRASSLTLHGLFDNRAIWISVAVLAVLQLVFVYAPFMNNLFRTVPPEARHWFIPFGIGAAVFVLVELEKYLINRFVK